jgi:FkbM family methyltransferase
MSILADWRTARDIEKGNFFEFIIEEVIKATCGPGDIAVDAGANCGVHTATMLSAGARTHAFEPNPELAAVLEAWGHKRLTVHGVALSDRRGVATFHFAENPGYGSLRIRPHLGVRLRDSREVSICRLDDFELSPKLIKADVEGEEVNFLRGAWGTLERARPVVLLEFDLQANGVAESVAMFEQLRDIGYGVFSFFGEPIRTVDWDSWNILLYPEPSLPVVIQVTLHEAGTEFFRNRRNWNPYPKIAEMPTPTTSDLNVVYDDKYHAARLEEAARSAVVVVPLLLELFPGVASVVDAGCSAGAWLHEFQLHGISRIMGLDVADIPPQLLQIDPSDVRRVDLRRPLPPLDRFDLALSLEVADCLPDEAAQQFVTSLTGLSDLVVFSAAVPGQSKHQTVNERWPSYWSALFAQSRFVCFDILRERLWYDQRVSWHYSQNILVFASEFRKDLLGRLSSMRRVGALDIVHPRAFELFRSEARLGGTAPLKLYPLRLVEEGYEGFNILQIDVDKFLALAQSEGSYSPEKLADGGYERAYVADSVEKVKAKIPVFPVRLVEEGYRGYNILHIGPDRFLALAQSEGAYSREKLAAGGYERAYVAVSAKEAKRSVKHLRPV